MERGRGIAKAKRHLPKVESAERASERDLFWSSEAIGIWVQGNNRRPVQLIFLTFGLKRTKGNYPS